MCCYNFVKEHDSQLAAEHIQRLSGGYLHLAGRYEKWFRKAVSGKVGLSKDRLMYGAPADGTANIHQE